MRWRGLFIFRGGAAAAAVGGRKEEDEEEDEDKDEEEEEEGGGGADEWKPPTEVEGKFAVLRSGLRGVGTKSTTARGGTSPCRSGSAVCNISSIDHYTHRRRAVPSHPCPRRQAASRQPLSYTHCLSRPINVRGRPTLSFSAKARRRRRRRRPWTPVTGRVGRRDTGETRMLRVRETRVRERRLPYAVTARSCLA